MTRSDTTVTVLPDPATRDLWGGSVPEWPSGAGKGTTASSATEDRTRITRQRLAQVAARASSKTTPKTPFHATIPLVVERIGTTHVHPQARIKILGETFLLEPSEAGVAISHPRWSLLGEGPSVLAAEADLFQEAADLAPVFLHAPLASLDKEALLLREFIIKTLG
jgi:hypothetical protein